jgi:hypothetical protein
MPVDSGSVDRRDNGPVYVRFPTPSGLQMVPKEELNGALGKTPAFIATIIASP